MQTNDTASPPTALQVSERGVLFAFGPNLSLRVRYGALEVSNGRAGSARITRTHQPRLRRLVIAGRGGWWTFEVPAWLRGIGASWLQVDLSGHVLGTGPGDISPDLPALRRRQAQAADTRTGLEISRSLIASKLDGQASVIASLQESRGALASIERARKALGRARRADDIRLAEARAAAAYWERLSHLPLTFARSDRGRVAAGWLTVGPRASIVSGHPRKASTPAHAVWNFCYALAAVEVRFAVQATGLDPGVGFGLHTDAPNRDSAVYDTLEAVRPEVDRFVVQTLSTAVFSRRSFVELPSGQVRLTAPMARQLADTMTLWRGSAGPVAEGMAKMLAGSIDGPPSRMRPLPTRLTESNRSAGRDGLRKRPRRAPASSRVKLPPACRSCGILLADADRHFCDDCLPEHKAASIETGRERAVEKLAALRASGKDPARRPEVRRRIGEANARRHAEAVEYERRVGDLPSPEVFRHEILPDLQGVSVRAMMDATGLSRGMCSVVRRGREVPHPMHWERLRELVSSSK